MEHQGDAAKSVLSNQTFAAARKRLGVEQPISLSYMDLPKLAPRGYQMVLIGQRSLLGFADMFGLQTPAMVLPPLNEIMPHLRPSASATWVDDAGWHYKSVTPFPGAQLLGGEQAVVAAAAPVLAAVALPAMAKARQQAVAVQSMSNLRQIGLAVHMYANEHNGDLPPDLGSTYPYLRNPAMYFMPANQQMMMAKPQNLSDEQLRKWISETSDYAYLGKAGMKLAGVPDTARYIIAHEKLDRVQQGLATALFLDGHVERVAASYLQQQLNEQAKRGKPDQGQ
jgi:prepilin-type processing-associated H-X9-DG protein